MHPCQRTMDSGNNRGSSAVMAVDNGQKNQGEWPDGGRGPSSRRLTIDIVTTFYHKKHQKPEGFDVSIAVKEVIEKMMTVEDAKVSIVDKKGTAKFNEIGEFPEGLEEFYNWFTPEYDTEGNNHCVYFSMEADMKIRDIKDPRFIEYLRKKNIRVEEDPKKALAFKTFGVMVFMHPLTFFGPLENEAARKVEAHVNQMDDNAQVKQEPYYRRNKDDSGNIVCPPIRFHKGTQDIKAPDLNGEIHDHSLDVLFISTIPEAISF